MSDRVTFVQLQRQWGRVLEARQQRLARHQTVVTESWRRTMTEMQAHQVKLQVAGAWVRGPADFLGGLTRDRDELTHSAALAWLLDPLGGHGLGGSLLRHLLEHLDVEVVTDSALSQTMVRREVVHPVGRADLLIDLPGLRIIIENKIDAVEQPRQAQRMVAAFDTDNAYYVFLTLHGATPSTAVGVEDRWTSLSYRTLAGWLRSLTAPAGDEQLLAARAYLETIERIAGGTHRG